MSATERTLENLRSDYLRGIRKELTNAEIDVLFRKLNDQDRHLSQVAAIADRAHVRLDNEDRLVERVVELERKMEKTIEELHKLKDWTVEHVRKLRPAEQP